VSTKQQRTGAAKASLPKAGAAKAGAAKVGQQGSGYLEPPKSLLMGVRLMYAAAALTALGLVIQVILTATESMATLRSQYPHATLAQLHHTPGVLIVSAVFSGVIEIGLWLFMARANRAGLPWARYLASALFAISTIILATTLTGSSGLLAKLSTGLLWLIGAGAVYFLWQRDSTAFYKAPAASAPSG
jgi:hypothetical protein